MLDRIRRALSAFLEDRETIAYREQVGSREPMTNAQFVQRFYPGHPQPCVPLAVASVVRIQLRIASLHPDDNLAVAFPDVPFGELVHELEAELGLDIGSIDAKACDGTAGGLVAVFTQQVEHDFNDQRAISYVSSDSSRYELGEEVQQPRRQFSLRYILLLLFWWALALSLTRVYLSSLQDPAGEYGWWLLITGMAYRPAIAGLFLRMSLGFWAAVFVAAAWIAIAYRG